MRWCIFLLGDCFVYIFLYTPHQNDFYIPVEYTLTLFFAPELVFRMCESENTAIPATVAEIAGFFISRHRFLPPIQPQAPQHSVMHDMPTPD